MIEAIGGSGVIFACEAYIKVTIAAESKLFQNEDILSYEKNISIWSFGPPYFPIVKVYEKWPLKSDIWSQKSILLAFEPWNFTKVKDQLNFQDLTGFGSSFTIIWKIWTILGEKMAKMKNCDFTKFAMTFLKIDLEG